MNSLIIRSHLGLGDFLIINAIVRDRAARFDSVFLPCKTQNMPSVQFMFRDLQNVHVLSVADDSEADLVTRKYVNDGAELLGLGMFGSKPFDIQQWDKEMYRQAGLPFSDRWDKFYIQRDESMEPKWLLNPWIFCHDDPERQFVIDSALLPESKTVVRPNSLLENGTIFYWLKLIEGADEIHAIDSCFAILADSVPTRANRLILHLYARHGANPPHYRKNWVILPLWT